MRKLTQEVYRQWKDAKAKAIHQCREQGDHKLAAQINKCKVFNGKENMEELANKIFLPVSIEFMVRFGFPDIETFRKFKPFCPEQYGIYIDCGNLVFSDSKRIFAIGNTTVTAKYRETQLNRLYALCGAKATVDASGYSVVRVEHDAESHVEIMINDNAKVML